MSGKKQAATNYGLQQQGIQHAQQSLVNQMRTERQGYQKQAEDILSQTPQYIPPEQIQQYQALMESLGSQLQGQIGGAASTLQGTDYMSGGQADLMSNLNQMLGSIQSGYGEAKDITNQGASSLRDIINRGVSASQGYAEQGMERGLSDTDSFVDYYRSMAQRQEMPGQRALEDKLGRNYAEGYKALQQQSGGSASGLGAMIDLYSNKSEALSDIGMQASQYKAQQEQQLALAQERAQAIRSSIYSQMSEGALNRAGVAAQGEQAATGMQAGAATDMASAMAQGYQARGGAAADYATTRQGMAGQQATTLANLYSQGATGQASLSGAGLLEGATAADTAYQYNQLMPWQAQANYYTQMIQSLNPYQAQSDLYGQQQTSLNNLFELFGKKGRFGI